MSDDYDAERERIIRERARPTVVDAVRLCKLGKIQSPTELWLILNRLTIDWVNIHDMTGSWE